MARPEWADEITGHHAMCAPFVVWQWHPGMYDYQVTVLFDDGPCALCYHRSRLWRNGSALIVDFIEFR